MLLLCVVVACLRPGVQAAEEGKEDPFAAYQGAMREFMKREVADNTWISSIFKFASRQISDGAREVPADMIVRSTNQNLEDTVLDRLDYDASADSERSDGYRRPVPLPAHGHTAYGAAVQPAVQPDQVSGLTKLLGGILPNTYYSRPEYRYPYYDHTGKGYLLYGYGGKELYEYSIFKPLEGYY